jgi:hypothetical protein
MSKSLIEITGFKELESKIKALANDKDKKAEILLILRQVARPTLAAAQSLVPVSKKPHKARGVLVQPGNLQKSIGFISNKIENPTVIIGARAKGQYKGWYGAIVHEGHNIYHAGFKRKHKARANDHAAKSRTIGQPYLRNAFSATEGLVTADAEKRVTAFIQRRIEKLSK